MSDTTAGGACALSRTSDAKLRPPSAGSLRIEGSNGGILASSESVGNMSTNSTMDDTRRGLQCEITGIEHRYLRDWA
eukprot:m.956823 g.956823  ORF g.956823 m.956823 type:complete len:77 (-) comp23875_c1_seq7:47-277(-)